LLSASESEPFLVLCQHWLEKAVIGLNLCPFAQAVHSRGQIRWVVSDATTEEALLADLRNELLGLQATDPNQTDTTLLVHPSVLQDFADYNAFLDPAEALLTELELDGEIQLASFHPAYQFAGTEPDDITNCTNRSPFPMLHLLREASLARGLQSVTDPESIFEANLKTMRGLGHEGWARLGVQAAPPAPAPGCPVHRPPPGT
jgi:hypothetical protein